MTKIPQKVLRHMFKAEMHVTHPDFFENACEAFLSARYFSDGLPCEKTVDGRTYTVSRTEAGTWKVIQE